MTPSRAEPESGFTLIEVLIAVGIIAATVAAGFGVTLASRSFAVAGALTEFDHILDSARTIARETQGVTLVFAPDAYGDGTEVRVMAGGPNGALAPTNMPIMHTRAAIEERESLGASPFAFVLHAGGALGGRPGFRLDDAATHAEVGCPASGRFHVVIHTAGATGDRYLPCRIDLASSGPVAYESWAPATPGPTPTACTGPSCGGGTLPKPPASNPTCPPRFAPIPGGCVPGVGSANAPAYHVTATAASPSISLGGSDAVTAQATLTNPSVAPAGTPASVPVLVQVSPSTCSASPTGSQPSGTAFAVTATAAGTCTVAVQADVTGVAGATADSATLALPISAAPIATPTPASCDLTANGKCYVRIVSETSYAFYKTVYPATSCPVASDVCIYLNSPGLIELSPSFSFTAPTPPTDVTHELLFRIERISSATYGCKRYDSFSSIPATTPLQWDPSVTGSASNMIGAGQPDAFANTNHVIQQTAFGIGNFDEPSSYSWPQNPTAAAMYEAVAMGFIGAPFSFTYSSASAAASPVTLWFADFPGCDVSGDVSASGVEYGVSGIDLVFEVYQAVQQ